MIRPAATPDQTLLERSENDFGLAMEEHELTLHPVKTRLVQFGKALSKNGKGKSGNGTFEYLRFTHYWARTRWGGGTIKRKTVPKRGRRAMKALCSSLLLLEALERRNCLAKGWGRPYRATKSFISS